MKKLLCKTFLILPVTFVLLLSGCFQVLDDQYNGGVISFNLSEANAVAGASSSSASTNMRSAVDESPFVKIAEDGSLSAAITLPSGMNLAPIVAVFQPPENTSSDIYIVFSNSNWYNYYDSEKGIYVNSGISQLICIHSDGTWDDVLGNTSKSLWAYNSDYSKCLKFDSQGNLYYLCNEYSSGSSSFVFYKYNSNKKENTQLTVALSSYSYEKFQVSKDGEYIFVEGQKWTSNTSSDKFIRAIPIASPDDVTEILYGSIYEKSWTYDDSSDALYISYYNQDNYWRNEFLIVSKDDSNAFTKKSNPIVSTDNGLPRYDTLMVSDFGIWGVEVYASNSITKLFDENRDYVAKEISLPSGYSFRSFVATSDALYVECDILNGSSKTGKQTILRLPADSTSFTNVFENVPDNASIELVTWSVSEDTLYFCGVRGLTISTGRIDTGTLSYTAINSGTKYSCILALR